jgi:hypothetical protein
MLRNAAEFGVPRPTDTVGEFPPLAVCPESGQRETCWEGDHQVCTIHEMMRILEALPERFEVCYESSCGYGHGYVARAANIVPTHWFIWKFAD